MPGDVINESYSYVDWESACHFENLAMKDPRALQEALAKINPDGRHFPRRHHRNRSSFHLEMVQDLNDAIEACLAVEQVLEQKCGKDAPPVAPVQRSAQFDSTTRLPGLACTRSASRSSQRRTRSRSKQKNPKTDYGPVDRFAVAPTRTADCRKPRITCFAPNPTARHLI